METEQAAATNVDESGGSSAGQVPWAKYLTVEDKQAKHSSDSLSIVNLDEQIVLPTPSNSSHSLVAVPFIRHWLFAPDKTKLRLRKFEVDVIHDGAKIVQSVTIGDPRAAPNKGYGILTTRHQRVLFALQCIWQKQGGRTALVNNRRQAVVAASSYELEQLIYGSRGGRQKGLLRQAVQELHSIPVQIDNFIGPEGEVRSLDMTGLICGALFSESRRHSQNQLGFPWVEIALGPLITRSFEIGGAVKPLNLEVMRGLKGDIPALLYPKLDYYLATNPGVELRLSSLVAKLGLTAKQLQQRAHRKRQFEASIEALKNKPLSMDGYSLELRLVPTSDNKDDKLIAERKGIARRQRTASRAVDHDPKASC